MGFLRTLSLCLSCNSQTGDRMQHSREDFDIMSVLRPVIPLLAGTCLSSASYNTRELINGLYFWFPLIGGLMTHVITDRQIVDFLCLAVTSQDSLMARDSLSVLTGSAIAFLRLQEVSSCDEPLSSYQRLDLFIKVLRVLCPNLTDAS